MLYILKRVKNLAACTKRYLGLRIASGKSSTSKRKGSNMLGIKDLKEAVYFGLKVGEAASDGFSYDDFGVLTSLPAAISGISNVPDELADLDEEEAEELKQFVQDSFDIPDDRLEEMVEKAVYAAIAVYQVYQAWVDMRAEQTGNL